MYLCADICTWPVDRGHFDVQETDYEQIHVFLYRYAACQNGFLWLDALASQHGIHICQNVKYFPDARLVEQPTCIFVHCCLKWKTKPWLTWSSALPLSCCQTNHVHSLICLALADSLDHARTLDHTRKQSVHAHNSHSNKHILHMK